MPRERIIHIVDDDDAFRESLKELLESAGFTAFCYGSAKALLDTAAHLVNGCIVLDIQMPEMDGHQLQVQLKELKIPLPIIVTTGYGDVPTAVRAMKAGAVDFVEKPFDDEPFFAAVERALALPGDHLSGDRATAAARIALLSPRERDVLRGIIAGRPNKVIAANLGISVRTVEVHRAHMLDRLNAGSTAEAIRLAVWAELAVAGT